MQAFITMATSLGLTAPRVDGSARLLHQQQTIGRLLALAFTVLLMLLAAVSTGLSTARG